LGLVFAGGVLGTALRHALSLADGGSPWATLFVNLTGAFLLGWLLGRLGHRTGARESRRRAFLGTGLLGSYTTYSTFVVALAGTTVSAADWAVALLSVPTGVLVAGAGLRLGGRHA
jgi:fluoride exporter